MAQLQTPSNFQKFRKLSKLLVFSKLVNSIEITPVPTRDSITYNGEIASEIILQTIPHHTIPETDTPTTDFSETDATPEIVPYAKSTYQITGTEKWLQEGGCRSMPELQNGYLNCTNKACSITCKNGYTSPGFIPKLVRCKPGENWYTGPKYNKFRRKSDNCKIVDIQNDPGHNLPSYPYPTPYPDWTLPTTTPLAQSGNSVCGEKPVVLGSKNWVCKGKKFVVCTLVCQSAGKSYKRAVKCDSSTKSWIGFKHEIADLHCQGSCDEDELYTLAMIKASQRVGWTIKWNCNNNVCDLQCISERTGKSKVLPQQTVCEKQGLTGLWKPTVQPSLHLISCNGDEPGLKCSSRDLPNVSLGTWECFSRKQNCLLHCPNMIHKKAVKCSDGKWVSGRVTLSKKNGKFTGVDVVCGEAPKNPVTANGYLTSIASNSDLGVSSNCEVNQLAKNYPNYEYGSADAVWNCKAKSCALHCNKSDKRVVDAAVCEGTTMFENVDLLVLINQHNTSDNQVLSHFTCFIVLFNRHVNRYIFNQ